MSRVAIYRKAHFNAAHRLYNEDWDDAKNKEVFGVCSNANYHGHNYELEVKVVGEVDPETGMVIDLKVLKDIIKDKIEDRYDHKNLNLDVDDFKTVNTSAENICIKIYEILREEINEQFDLSVRLFETPRNFVEYPA